MVVLRLYSQEVDRSAALNQALGVGIGVFQGLSNVVLNGAYFDVMCCMYSLHQVDILLPCQICSMFIL